MQFCQGNLCYNVYDRVMPPGGHHSIRYGLLQFAGGSAHGGEGPGEGFCWIFLSEQGMDGDQEVLCILCRLAV